MTKWSLAESSSVHDHHSDGEFRGLKTPSRSPVRSEEGITCSLQDGGRFDWVLVDHDRRFLR